MTVAIIREDSNHRRTGVPIASDALPGFGIAVGPAPPPALLPARLLLPRPPLLPPVFAEPLATGRRAAGGDARSV